MKYCKLKPDKTRCIKTNNIDENDMIHCDYNVLTNQCRKKISNTKKISSILFDQDIINRKQELDNNILFNNTTFVVDPDTYEIQSPILKNPDISCSSNQEEFFRNCFKQMGQGSIGVFYSPEINKQFGIRKLEINIESKDALENEISLLRFFRQNFDEFPFVAQMYGWMDYDNRRYIILEHKDTDLNNMLEELSTNNVDITDEFLTIFSIIVIQLFYFTKYNIYHQDLHTGNVLIKKYDSPVHITWGGLNVYTKYVPFIHDFDYAGVRGTSIIQNINNTDTVQNQYWLDTYYKLPDIESNPNYYLNCYDVYQIFNSMVYSTITEKNKLNNEYNISIDLVYIFNKLFKINISNNNFKKYIIISRFDKNNYKIINKNNNVEYKMNLHVENFLTNMKNINTPILFYSQLNPFYNKINELCDVYNIFNIHNF